MKARYIILLILTFATVHGYRLMAQSPRISGYAVYEMGTDYNHRTVEFWFTAEDYIYKYKLPTDIRQTPAYRNKKYNNTQDSLDEAKKIDALNARIKSAPEQHWYGKLGTDEVIYSSFDNTFKTYCVKDTVSFVRWELLTDTMTIQGMACQKASGTYNNVTYTAWFAPSIPVSTAPLQFRGLPGLLVKAVNNVTNISITLTNLEWPAKTPVAIQPCSGSPFISKTELQKIRETQNANAYKMVEAARKDLQKKTHQ